MNNYVVYIKLPNEKEVIDLHLTVKEIADLFTIIRSKYFNAQIISYVEK